MRLVSTEEARRIAVRSQLLDGSATNVLDTVRKLGFLQLDPISTVAPPQQLVLWSRLGPVRRRRARPPALGGEEALRVERVHLADRGVAVRQGADAPTSREVHVGAARGRVPQDERPLQAACPPRARAQRPAALPRARRPLGAHVRVRRLVRHPQRRGDARHPPRTRPRRNRRSPRTASGCGISRSAGTPRSRRSRYARRRSSAPSSASARSASG